MAYYVTGLALWAALLWLSFALGARVFKILKIEADTDIGRLSFSLALGMGLLGYVFFIFGIFGLIYVQVIPVMMAVLFLLTIRETAAGGRMLLRMPGKLNLPGSSGRAVFMLAGASFVLLISVFLRTFLPPTDNDALVYQLYLPKLFAMHHGVTYLPYQTNSLFPFLIQMHYMVACLFKVPWVAQAIHWAAFCGIAGGVYYLCRRFTDPLGGFLGVLILLTTPGMAKQAALPVNDIALAFFTFFAVVSAYKALVDMSGIKLWLLAGIFSGFALSVKYTAVLHVIPLTLLCLFFPAAQPLQFKVRMRHLAVYLGAATIFSFIWYLRSWIYEGNPLYPFFGSIFGGTAKDYDLAKQGYGKGIWDLLAAPWRMTMDPWHFGGSWTQIGCIYLAGLPFLFLKKPSRAETFFYCVAGLFFLQWFFLVQNLRFLYPALPVLAVILAIRLRPYWKIMMVPIALQSLIILYFALPAARFLLGGASVSRYLENHVRPYPAAAWINDNLPAGSKILVFGESHSFYFDRELYRVNEFLKKNIHQITEKTPGGFAAAAKREGADYILFAKSAGIPDSMIQEWHQAIMDPAAYGASLSHFHEIDAGGMIYSVYRIEEQG